MEVKFNNSELEQVIGKVTEKVVSMDPKPIPPFIDNLSIYCSNLSHTEPHISKKVVGGHRLYSIMVWNPVYNTKHSIELMGTIEVETNNVVITNYSIQG